MTASQELTSCLVIQFANGKFLPIYFSSNELREQAIETFNNYVKGNELSSGDWYLCEASSFKLKDIQYLVRAEYLPVKVLEVMNVV